ncbi:glycoside hydrolase family 3 N-terminal domain-containing protein [Pseudogemmobacter sonorensis]|uniref:glycoside hydrolase family 3 N-terminal domain-containing protein n=1 Tax=Pseudogemmobacter sonorensis TaxID=2989681 RepID=UPI0036CDCA01
MNPGISAGTNLGTTAAIFGLSGPDLLPQERDFFRETDPFGFILFARNVETPDQLRRLTGDLRGAVGRAAPILVDQEGGRVQRLRAPHWREWAPPLETAERAGPDAARLLWLRARLIAQELHAVGIDADCAPVCDLARPETHAFLKNRCHGGDPARVAQLGRAVAEGLLAGGVLPVMKHIPGHGRSRLDTHHDLPLVDAPLAELEGADFSPFRALADLPMAMTGHLVFSAIDAARPATQSPAVVRLIRESIGFDGLLMTDDLNMEALSGGLADRTALAMAAGVDIALHCKGDLQGMAQVAGAAGAMGAATRARAARALACRRPPAEVDIAGIEAELEALSRPA